MIIVEGWVRLAAGEAEKSLPALLRMVEETRREPGCLEYAFARDMAEPDLVRIIERWQDDAALTAHFATPHMAAFGAAMAAAKIVNAQIDSYTAEFARTVMKAP